MNKRDVIIEKFKVLLASIFPIEEEVIETPEKTEVTLAEAALEDGTIITYDQLVVDAPINVVNPDKTLSPLGDGTYDIADMVITVVAGIITEVNEKPIETENPEPVVIVEPPAMMEEEKPEEKSNEPAFDDIDALIEGKVNEVKLAYEDKLAKQKSEFEAQIEALGNQVKDTKLIQAPVEEKKPLTYKERLAVELSEKRKANLY